MDAVVVVVVVAVADGVAVVAVVVVTVDDGVVAVVVVVFDIYSAKRSSKRGALGEQKSATEPRIGSRKMRLQGQI